MALSVRELAGTRSGSGAFELSALRQGGRVHLVFFYVGPGGNSWTAYEKCEECPPGPGPVLSPSIPASRQVVPRHAR